MYLEELSILKAEVIALSSRIQMLNCDVGSLMFIWHRTIW